MNKAITEFTANSGENTGFTATGSGKTLNSPPKPEETEENQPILQENAAKDSETDNFPNKRTPNHSKVALNAEKESTFRQTEAENTEETQSNGLSNNSAVQPQNSSKFDETLFDDASIQAFSRDFPGVDIENLRSSENFQAFLGILNKNPTLSQVYACFNSIFARAEESSQKKLLQALANAKSSVGSLSSSHESSPPFFTKEQVQRMSPEQIRANYTHIRKSQEKW